LTPAKDEEPEKLWLKGKEVIADPQKQYEIARDLHHKSHGGINKTTAAIAELYHWVRIKETVSQVIRNCPECSEMNKGLSAMRQNQNQNQSQARYSQTSNGQSPLTPTPPVEMYTHVHPTPTPRRDSPSSQLIKEAAQQQTPFSAYPQRSTHDMPLDPALMEGIQTNGNLADLPPSPFLTAGDGSDGIPQAGDLDALKSGAGERLTAREELRRRLNRVGAYVPQ
jgi:hypothetical protein